MNEDSGDPPRLLRSEEGRLITGVCAGLAGRTRIDAIVFRVAFALLVITTGVGVLLYLFAFLLMGGPDGRPSWIARTGKRLFDGDTALEQHNTTQNNNKQNNNTHNKNTNNTLSVVVVFGLALLVARS